MSVRLTITTPPAIQGLAWIKQGWAMFMAAPVAWSGMTAFILLVLMAAALLPFLGSVLVHVLSPFIVAGFMAASRAAERGETVSFIALGAGLQAGRPSLLVMGLVYLVANLGIFAVVSMLTGIQVNSLVAQLQNPQALTPEEAQTLLQGMTSSLLWMALLLTPLLMATWFAPALALFEAFPPIRAMWWSLWACSRNWRPLLLYSLLLGLFGLFAILIPWGLGLLVFIPWALTATYAAYRDIFQPVEAMTADQPGDA